ncbi:lysine-sensitive aspartokinase 3 [Candidatus Woesearchaeota archaeon]|nr:lysine-sensitive aspartokinase 3 [Candidatus Woesearchaeota archaeon]
MKFGGTSVGSADRIRNTCNIIKSNLKRKPIIVVSAVAKITDGLIRLAKECSTDHAAETLKLIGETHDKIIGELRLDRRLLEQDFRDLRQLADETLKNRNNDEKTMDHFQSFGEQMSSKIVAAQLSKIGVKAKSFDSWELGFLTDSEFGNAEPLDVAYASLKGKIKKLSVVPVVTGFIGKTEEGEITTLGRGGSDFSAAVIGAAIDAEEIQIWTDVDGMMSTDPKIVPRARTLYAVSFAEASELAYFGAKVLHPKTILPAMKKNIPVRVLNSFNPKGKGTTIVNKAVKSKETVKAIACKNNTTLISVDSSRMLGSHGFMARIFYIFDKFRKSIDVISTSEVSVSLTLDDDEDIDDIVKELREFSSVEISKNKSIVCVVGEGMRHMTGLAGRTFTAMGKNNINIEMISQGASEINITFIVDSKDAAKAVQVLHREYFGD